MIDDSRNGTSEQRQASSESEGLESRGSCEPSYAGRMMAQRVQFFHVLSGSRRSWVALIG